MQLILYYSQFILEEIMPISDGEFFVISTILGCMYWFSIIFSNVWHTNAETAACCQYPWTKFFSKFANTIIFTEKKTAFESFRYRRHSSMHFNVCLSFLLFRYRTYRQDPWDRPLKLNWLSIYQNKQNEHERPSPKIINYN